MRVIIEPDYEKLSQWAAEYVINKINAAQPTAEKPFVLGLPTGSSPIGMYKALVKADVYKRQALMPRNVLSIARQLLKWMPTRERWTPFSVMPRF